MSKDAEIFGLYQDISLGFPMPGFDSGQHVPHEHLSRAYAQEDSKQDRERGCQTDHGIQPAGMIPCREFHKEPRDSSGTVKYSATQNRLSESLAKRREQNRAS